MLRARVISGLSIGAALLAATLVLPGPGALAIVLGLGVLGLREFFALLGAARVPSFRALGLLAGAAMILAAWATATGVAIARVDLEILTLALCLGAVFIRPIFVRGNACPPEAVGGTLTGLFFVAFPLTFLVRILMAWGPMTGRWPLFFMIAVVKMSDTGAYLVGRAFGRRRLVPRISPAKTWEGLAGGLLTAVGVSVAVRFLAGGRVGPMVLGTGDALVLAGLLTLSGLLGDLSESVLKRAAGAKDSSTLIAGMGGLLDVLDSLLPSAPLFYFYVLLRGI